MRFFKANVATRHDISAQENQANGERNVATYMAGARHSAPWYVLEARLWWRLWLSFGSCLACLMVQSSLRHRCVPCYGNAGHSLSRSQREVQQSGRHAHEGHVGPDERSVCVRSFGVVRLFVLSCSCPTRTVPVGVEGKNNHYLKLIAIVDSTVR